MSRLTTDALGSKIALRWNTKATSWGSYQADWTPLCTVSAILLLPLHNPFLENTDLVLPFIIFISPLRWQWVQTIVLSWEQEACGGFFLKTPLQEASTSPVLSIPGVPAITTSKIRYWTLKFPPNLDHGQRKKEYKLHVFCLWYKKKNIRLFIKVQCFSFCLSVGWTEKMLSTLDQYNFRYELTWAVPCIRGRNSLPELRLRERKREEKLDQDSNDKN